MGRFILKVDGWYMEYSVQAGRAGLRARTLRRCEDHTWIDAISCNRWGENEAELTPSQFRFIALVRERRRVSRALKDAGV